MAKLFRKKLGRLSCLLGLTVPMALILPAPAAFAAQLFPLKDVRLLAGPFLDAQTTDLNFIMLMEP